MSQSACYILTTEVSFQSDEADNIIAMWKEECRSSYAELYLSMNKMSLLELRGFDDLSELVTLLHPSKEESSLERLRKKIGQHLQSDYHQELLIYKEDVVPQSKKLPVGEFLQMRHIEVPIKVYDEYLDWRSRTIFQHVKKLPQVESFVAYHSLLSKQPGVMFLSSFSCDPEEYSTGFSNPAYSEIVKQAGDRFISGGTNGLYTKLYKRA